MKFQLEKIVDVIKRILQVILPLYLPYDVIVNNIIGIAIADVICDIFLGIVVSMGDKFAFFNNIFKKNYIIIKNDNPIFDNLLDYIKNNHNNIVLGYNVYNKDGDVGFKIDGLKKSSVRIYYNDKKKINKKIAIDIELKMQEKNEKTSNFIIIRGKCSLETLRYFINDIKKQIDKNYIIVDQNNPIFDSLTEYIKKRHTDSIRGYKITNNENNKTTYNIEEMKELCISIPYVHDDVEYLIKMSMINQNVTNKKNKYIFNGKIKIEGVCSSNIILLFIESVVAKINGNSVKFNGRMVKSTLIYNVIINNDKKNDVRDCYWESSDNITNKSLNNTILNKNVKKNLIDDINFFISNDEYYYKKGIPYKKGYLLYGPPGCGKTSLIKAIANYHDIPIFIIDLSILESNNELTQLNNEILNHVAKGTFYMVIYEDVDRTKLFDKWNYCSKITEDCFLNIIDGINEYYGRITILTTNNKKVIKKMPALLRPGRIDKQVEVTYCDLGQITGILSLHFDSDEDKKLISEFDKNIQITPAQLTHIIMSVQNIKIILEILNNNNVFEDKKIDSLLGPYILNKQIMEDGIDGYELINIKQSKNIAEKINNIKNKNKLIKELCPYGGTIIIDDIQLIADCLKLKILQVENEITIFTERGNKNSCMYKSRLESLNDSLMIRKKALEPLKGKYIDLNIFNSKYLNKYITRSSKCTNAELIKICRKYNIDDPMTDIPIEYCKDHPLSAYTRRNKQNKSSFLKINYQKLHTHLLLTIDKDNKFNGQTESKTLNDIIINKLNNKIVIVDILLKRQICKEIKNINIAHLNKTEIKLE